MIDHLRRMSLFVLALPLGCVVANPDFDVVAKSTGGGTSSTSSASSTSSTSSVSATSAMSGSPTSTVTTDGVGVGETSGGIVTSGGGSTEVIEGTSTQASSGGELSTGGSSSGGEKVCEPVAADPLPRLMVKKNGMPAPKECGKSQAMSKGVAEFAGNTVRFYQSGDCQKKGTVWEITGVGFDITPMPFGAACSNMRLVWGGQPTCELVGFGLSNGGQPMYVGGFSQLSGPTDFLEFKAAPTFDCGCTVDDVDCCSHVLGQDILLPGHYKLGFPMAKESIAVGQTVLGTVGGSDFTFKALGAQVRQTCGMIPLEGWFGMHWWAEPAA